MTFHITPVCNGTPSNSDPLQMFNISDWTWAFPSGKLYIKSEQFGLSVLITLCRIFHFPVYAC